jgi:multiple sugar transport system permease protein
MTVRTDERKGTGTSQAPTVRRAQRRAGRTVGRYAGAFLLAVWVLFPMYLLTIGTFSAPSAIYQYPRSLLPGLSLATMRFFLGSAGVPAALGRSVIVAGITAVLAMAVGAPAGYALARFRFRLQGSYRVTILSTRSFPVVVLSIPLAVFFLQWGIYDTVWAVALMHTALALPFVVLITSSVFDGVAVDLEEAAQVFGCGRLGAFLRVVVPLTIPGLAAAGAFTVLMSYNEVFAASILTLEHPTLPALVLNALSDSPNPYKYAAAWLLMAPTFAFIFLIRRYILGFGVQSQL